MSEVTTPAPNTAPESTPALDALIATAFRDDGMNPPPFEATQVEQETKTAELVASSDAPLIAQPDAKAVPPTADLTPRQAALQMLNSSNPETQKMGKKILDEIFEAENKPAVQEKGIELPVEPDWNARKADIQKDVTNYFRERSKRVAKDEAGIITDEKGDPVYHYEDPSEWMVEVETERRLERERSQHSNKINEIKEKAAHEAGVKAAEKQWNEGMDSTVQSALLGFLYENVTSARAKTANGNEGVKRTEYEKHVRLAKALARQVSEEVNFDDPRFSGPNGMTNALNEIGTRLTAQLSQYIPKDGTQAKPNQVLTPPPQKTVPATGAPVNPGYTPPKPGESRTPWDKLPARQRAEVSLYDRMMFATGGSAAPAGFNP